MWGVGMTVKHISTVSTGVVDAIAQMESVAASIEFVDFATANDTSVTQLVISKPTGTVQDDFMLCFIVAQPETDETPNDPTGWTKPAAFLGAGGASSYAWTKVAGGSEPSTYTFDGFDTTGALGGFIATWRGGATSSPVDGIVRSHSSSPPISNEVTTGSNNSTLIQFGGGDYGAERTFTESGGDGMVERIDTWFSGASDICLFLYDGGSGSAGAYTREVTPSADGTLCWLMGYKL